MRGTFLALAAWLIAGCASPEPPHRYFVLDEATAWPREAAATVPRRDITLLVAPVSATGFYRSREIVYSRATGTRSHYLFNSWTEPPATAIDHALMTALESSGGFGAVVPMAPGVEGALLLRVQLDELYHDATAPPGSARIVLSAQLSNPRTRTPIDKRTFTASAPATSYDAAGAVAGLRQALQRALDGIVGWAAAVPAPP